MVDLGYVLTIRRSFGPSEQNKTLVDVLLHRDAERRAAYLSDLVTFPGDAADSSLNARATSIFERVQSSFGADRAQTVTDLLDHSRKAVMTATNTARVRLDAKNLPPPEISFLERLLSRAENLMRSGPIYRYADHVAAFTGTKVLTEEEGSAVLTELQAWQLAHLRMIEAGAGVVQKLEGRPAEGLFTAGVGLFDAVGIEDFKRHERFWRELLPEGLQEAGKRWARELYCMRFNRLAEAGLAAAVLIGFGCFVYHKEPDTLRKPFLLDS